MPVAKIFDGTNFKRVKKGMVFRNIEGTGILSQPVFSRDYEPSDYLSVNERLSTEDYYSVPTFSYSIT
jgi:hypothetical protein